MKQCSFFANSDVSKLHLLSVRDRACSFICLFSFYLSNRDLPGLCYVWLYSLEIMLKQMVLLKVFFLDELEIKYVVLVSTISVLADSLGHTILIEMKD